MGSCEQKNSCDNTAARAVLLKANLALKAHVTAQGNRIGESDVWSLNRITAVKSFYVYKRQHTFLVSSICL
jgi:hypothetical protein